MPEILEVSKRPIPRLRSLAAHSSPGLSPTSHSAYLNPVSRGYLTLMISSKGTRDAQCSQIGVIPRFRAIASEGSSCCLWLAMVMRHIRKRSRIPVHIDLSHYSPGPTSIPPPPLPPSRPPPYPTLRTEFSRPWYMPPSYCLTFLQYCNCFLPPPEDSRLVSWDSLKFGRALGFIHPDSSCFTRCRSCADVD